MTHLAGSLQLLPTTAMRGIRDTGTKEGVNAVVILILVRCWQAELWYEVARTVNPHSPESLQEKATANAKVTRKEYEV